jgi:hypothetical protein
MTAGPLPENDATDGIDPPSLASRRGAHEHANDVPLWQPLRRVPSVGKTPEHAAPKKASDVGTSKPRTSEKHEL